MQEQLEKLAQMPADYYFPGSLPANPNALNLARKLVEEFSHLGPCPITCEPEDGAVSFEWGYYGIFVTVEVNLDIEYTQFDNNHRGQCEFTKIFKYPDGLDELTQLIDKRVPKNSTVVKIN